MTFRNPQFTNPLAYNPAHSNAPVPSAPALPHSNNNQQEVDAECEAAKAELRKYGFPQSHRAHIAIALDISYSMQTPNRFYSEMKIARLLRKAMAMAIELSPNKEHSIDIFPFGHTVWGPFTIKEADLESAIDLVLSLTGGYSPETNYNVVAEAIRQKYTGSSAKPHGIVSTEDEPVFCMFVTDGEPIQEIAQAKKQFKWSENNAIFFKFIALIGQQSFFTTNPDEVPFRILKEICNPKSAKILNKDLIILDDPDKLTIQDLFKGYRAWAEDAATHKIIPDPEFVFVNANKHDKAERDLLKAFNKSHGHKKNETDHGHVNDSNDVEDHDDEENQNSGYGLPILFGISGAVILPLLLPTLPLLLMVTAGAAVGLLSNYISTSIYKCIFPSTEDSDHEEDIDSDDDQEVNQSSPNIYQQLGVAPSPSAIPGPAVAYQQQHSAVYYPLNADVQQQGIPSAPPPAYHP
jgi:hypothetical protein